MWLVILSLSVKVKNREGVTNVELPPQKKVEYKIINLS